MANQFYRSLLFLCLTLAVSCKQDEVEPQLSLEEQHLLLGNPSGATADPNNFNNYLMEKPQYVLSYSRDRGTPNWVSWHVNKDWVGNAPRQDDFRVNTTLPEGW